MDLVLDRLEHAVSLLAEASGTIQSVARLMVLPREKHIRTCALSLLGDVSRASAAMLAFADYYVSCGEETYDGCSW